jgi:uncharacterized protein YutE (UPF0331/DUF86 family)
MDPEWSNFRSYFGKHPDWEWRVYYLPDAHDEQGIQVPELTEIDTAINEVDQLKRAGYLRAALMIAWAALEAAGRAILPQDLARPQAANKLIEVLASEGVVTPTEADSLRKAIGLRNSITHGHFAVDINEQDIDQVVAAARSIRGLAQEPGSP